MCGSYGYCYLPDRCPKSDPTLTESEENNDSLDPFYADGGPTEWLGRGRPIRDDEGRAQHPIYREMQDRIDASLAAYRMEQGKYEAACSPEKANDPEAQMFRRMVDSRREHNTLPTWQPHTSAPAHSPEPVVADRPESTFAPGIASGDSGHLLEGGKQPAGAGDLEPGTGGSAFSSEVDAVVAALEEHHPVLRPDGYYHCRYGRTCGESHEGRMAWQWHVAPLIVDTLNELK